MDVMISTGGTELYISSLQGAVIVEHSCSFIGSILFQFSPLKKVIASIVQAQSTISAVDKYRTSPQSSCHLQSFETDAKAVLTR